ncbi:MAG: 2-C-methyl-D-erythritol 4-phosphate cytidylyltransferase [Thermoleophilia bacterium]|jgi:2-C-methyl-D-erythritol 4-phosphate cytidylyltransferase|nr:2-C-methyl-D-erythritol 4-phosphate cytidylyltransferase [Thermoleophilia bacterium]
MGGHGSRGEDVPTGAVVVAAGAGVRMGAPVPKALMPLAGRPMVCWSLDALAAAPEVGPVVVVAPPGLVVETLRAIGQEGIYSVIEGGPSRQRSVQIGLGALPEYLDRVLVHDAARPLVTPAIIARVLAGLDGADGAIAAAPVADTLKRAGADGLVAGTVDRAGLWGAQTPQAFWWPVLARAFATADRAALDRATDCAGMVEAAGGRVRLVDPGAPNLKVTTPPDADLAARLLGAAPGAAA